MICAGLLGIYLGFMLASTDKAATLESAIVDFTELQGLVMSHVDEKNIQISSLFSTPSLRDAKANALAIEIGREKRALRREIDTIEESTRRATLYAYHLEGLQAEVKNQQRILDENLAEKQRIENAIGQLQAEYAAINSG